MVTTVHSSTSSFDTPQGGYEPDWLMEWALAIGMALALLLSAEAFLRTQRFLPSAPDDRPMWAFERSRVYGDHPRDVIVLVGASRIRLGIDTETLRREFPGVRVVMLALNGTAPYAMLRDLTQDERFNGVVIYDLMERSERLQTMRDAKSWVEYYHSQSLDRRYHGLFRSAYLGRLVMFSPEFDPKGLLRDLIQKRELPRPGFVQYLPDRAGRARPELLSHPFDEQTNTKGFEPLLRRARTESGPEEWMSFRQDVERDATKLKGRGGDVVFLRMPSSGALWVLDEQYFPKAQFWDRMAAMTSFPTVHFKTMIGAEDWELYDGSHLDHRQSARFTATLANELRRLGVISGTAGR